MDYHVLTLFPDMIRDAFNTSIMGRAVKNGLISVHTVNIRDYSVNTRMMVDDYPYGGGAGMVMEAEPVFRAVCAARERCAEGTRVIYLTPQAKVLDQLKVEELAREKELIILCGHYEGIDDRVLEEVVTDNISIGDYVLSGGELGALVLMDAVSRFVPGVLNNEESSRFESMKDDLLEYPHYTRPEVWHDVRVPEVLLSGDHAKIEEWRHQKSLERTRERRPDLLAASYRTNVVSFGSEEAAGKAAALNTEVSLYGQLLDYNRSKLRKSRRRFIRKDLVLFVTDSPDPELLSAVSANIRSDGGPAFLICTGEPRAEKTNRAEERSASEETASDIREREEACLRILRECGFQSPVRMTLHPDDIGGTALAIRKQLQK